MEISFGSTKLAKVCNSKPKTVKKWGDQSAKKIRLRLTELQAADTLADMFTLPQARCHELKGDRAGQFALDAKDPYRLIVVPNHEPVPRREDGGVELSSVTKITILEFEHYHGD